MTYVRDRMNETHVLKHFGTKTKIALFLSSHFIVVYLRRLILFFGFLFVNVPTTTKNDSTVCRF